MADRGCVLQRASLTVEQVDALKEALGLPAEWRARVGAYFTMQLAYLQWQRLLDAYAIVHELRVLEGEPGLISRTKPPTAFQRPPLVGLWHKHHFDPYFILKNLSTHLGGLTHGRGLDHAVNAVFGESNERAVEEVVGQLASRLIDQTFFERLQKGRLTGEWIVYARRTEGNYYLTLGSHREAATLADRIRRSCGWEFPFLQVLLASESVPFSISSARAALCRR